MSLFPSLFFFFFFLSVLIAFADQDQSVVKLDLLHRHHPLVSKRLLGHDKPETLTDRFLDLHDQDQKRQRAISEKLFRNQLHTKITDLTPPTPTPIGLKMLAGADFGSGLYFVYLKVGTPPQTFMLIADTGSELTWMKCRYRRCRGNCSVRHKNPKNKKQRFAKAFLANLSSSFKTVDCSSQMCKDDFSYLFSLNICPTPTSPCVYDYSYIGGSSATGIFANETITVGLTDGKEAQLHNYVIGCTESMQGRSFSGSDGVLGLGFSQFSFMERAAQYSSGGFSYCLVDHLSTRNATNYLIFGASEGRIPSLSAHNPIYTKLFLGGPYSSFYGVDLVGISVDGVMLKIPSRAWNIESGGGTIMDSGTSLTLLTTPAYDKVMQALIPPLSKLDRIDLQPFDFCFNNTNFSYDIVPKLGFHFGDGAVFEPPAKSYVIRVGPTITCLGFLSTAFPATNIIGNIMQQNHLWQFDFVRRRVGFSPSDCVSV